MNILSITLNNININLDNTISFKIGTNIFNKKFLIISKSFFCNKYDIWRSKPGDIICITIKKRLQEQKHQFIFKNDRYWLKEINTISTKVKDTFLNFYPQAMDILISTNSNTLTATINNSINLFKFVLIGDNCMFLKEQFENTLKKEDLQSSNSPNNESEIHCPKVDCFYNKGGVCTYLKNSNLDEETSCNNPLEIISLAKSNPEILQFI